MGNRHVLRPGNASAATLTRMAQEVTIPNIPVARRPPRRQRALVRPYVRTGGRTQSTRNLAIEAMVSVRTGAPLNGPGINDEFRGIEYRGPEIRNAEYNSVLAVCRRPKSVAEVAAVLSVPLGVAKVLLGDMAELGLVIVHDTSADSDGRPALELMERILNGLRRL